MPQFTPPEPGSRVAVVGGSVIGLACAWRAARAGFDVRVLDPRGDAGDRGAAAWVAGGMLAPFSEAWPGEDDVFALSVASLRLWDGFLADLEPYESGIGPVRSARTTYLLAVDEADARDLDLAMGWAAERPGTRSGDVERIPRSELRAAEPGLARVARVAYRMAGEGSVDNRRLLAALRAACAAEGVTWEAATVTDLDDVDADRVVLAAGGGSAALTGLPIRPVKGEVLRLHARPGCEPPPRSVIRAFVRGRPVYLVPREGGLVVGATQYEHGDDRQVTAGGVRDLLADAETVFPGIGEYELREAAAGLRPMMPDNLPVLGPLPGDPRVLCATGHGRNGIALTPVTAATTLAWLTGDEAPPESVAARADRPAAARRESVTPGGSAHCRPASPVSIKEER